MSPGEDEVSQEQRTSWLAACDEALAAGDTPLDALAPFQRDVAFLRQLRQALEPASTAPRPVQTPTAEVPATELGRFRIVRELGRGSFGIVFLAHDPQLNREVALKVPRAEALVTPELRQRFQREARAAAGLEHANIVPVHEAGEVGPVCYIASAYCPGPTLAQWLRQQTEPVPFLFAAALVQALAQAVQHAHERGVVHRDLKPGNILLASGGREPPVADATGASRPPLAPLTPRITDFGLARLELEPGTGQTQSGAVLGTPSYMAPEQASGKSKSVGPLCDVYALGTILYELLVGRPPFVGETTLDVLLQARFDEPVPPSRLRPKVPRDLETICLKCLHKEPRKRYAVAAALAEDLRRFQAGEPIAARPVGRIERGWRWCRRNPAVASLLSAVFLLLSAGVTVATVLWVLADQRANALKKSNEELRQSRDWYEESVARGLLRPLGTHPSAPLNDHEINALWELASSSEDGLRRRFLEEAIRIPLTTRQLRVRRSFALHAAVGLDSRRRQVAERVLTEQLSAEGVVPEQQVDLAVTLSALGELSSPAALQAAGVLSRALSNTTNPSELRELAEGLSAVAAQMSPREAATLCGPAAAALAQTLTRAKDAEPPDVRELVQGLSAVAARMDPKDAAATFVQVMKNLGDSDLLWELAEGLSAAAARQSPKDAATVCGQVAASLAQTLSKAGDNDPTKPFVHRLSVAAWMDPRDAATLAAAFVQAMEKSADSGTLEQLAEGLSAVATRMDPSAAGPAAATLAQVLIKTANESNFVGLQGLAEGLSAVAARLDAREAATVCGPAVAALVQTMSKTTDLGVFKQLATGLSALAARLEPEAAAATFVQALSQTTNSHAQREYAQRLATAASRLDPKHAARVCGHAATSLAEALSKRDDAPGLWELAEGLAAVASRMDPREAATLCSQAAASLARAMSKTPDESDVFWVGVLAEGLSAVAARMDPREAATLCGQAAASLTRAMSRTTHPLKLLDLAQRLSSVAERMDPRDTAATRGQAAAVLAQTLSKTSDNEMLKELATGVPALASRMNPRDAATLAAVLVQVMGKTDDSHTRGVVAQRLSAVVARMDPREAATVCDRAASALAQALNRTTDPDVLKELAMGLSGVAAWMDPRHAAVFTQALSQTSDPDALRELAQGLSLVLAGIDLPREHRRSGAVGAAVALLPGGNAALTCLPLLQPAIEPLPCRLSTPQLVELLKHPLCVGESRRIVLRQLQNRYARSFADHWEFVRFAHEQGLNFTAAASRTPFAAERGSDTGR